MTRRDVRRSRRAKEARRFDHLDTRTDDERCPDTLDLIGFLARLDAADPATLSAQAGQAA